MSAGSDDDAMIFAFVTFSLPPALRVLRINRAVARFELVVLCCSGAETVPALWLASLDCASIFYTAFVLPDLLLAGAVLAMPSSIISLGSLRTTQ